MIGLCREWLGVMALALAMAIGAPASSSAEDTAKVTVFAAASLTEVLTDLARQWQEMGHGEVVLSFAASSKLARQIEQGAPADIFASADAAWMNYLVELQQIDASTVRLEIGNELVWIAPPGSTAEAGADPLAALGDGRLALGDPESVPAGKYAKEALTSLGLWNMLADRLAPTENVRAALALVEREEAPLGIVYATDARRSTVRVVGAIPSDSHLPIVFPMAIVAGRDNPRVRAFFDFITGPGGIDAFRAYGFRVRAPGS